MKYNAILLVLPALTTAVNVPAPAAAELINLVARQQTTTTTAGTASATITEGTYVTDCAASYEAYSSNIVKLLPATPSALESYYSSIYNTVTDSCGYNVALGINTMPESLISVERDYVSSAWSILSASNALATPTVCSEAYVSIGMSARTSARSFLLECMESYRSGTSASAAATTTAATSAVAPTNTGAAGRSGVSTGLAVGAVAAFGYFGLA